MFSLRRRALARELLSVTLAVLLASVTPAQTPPKTQDDDVVKVKSNLVNIDVIVKDKKGKYVSDLKAEDFTITENGQPQKLEFFDAPLSGGPTRAPGAPGTDTVTPATAPRNYVSLVLDFQTTDVTNLSNTLVVFHQ